MSEPWEAWLYGGDRYDRNTRRALEETRASEARARSNLANQLRREAGNLQSQIDRLTDAFVAFVEYEDVRSGLQDYADAAACRKYAREVVPNLVVTGGTGLAGLPQHAEVPGYWLSSAVRGLVSIADAGTGIGSARLAEARRCDDLRTSLLLVLVDALRREQRFSGEEHLAAVLPQSAGMTNVDRALWRAVADGRLGDAALATYEERLRSLLGTPDPAAVDEWVGSLVPRHRDRPEQIRASQTIGQLERLLVDGIAAPTTYAVEPASTDDPAGGGAAEDPLAEMLRSLVDQGAPGETEILTRMTEVRSQMGFVEAERTDNRWDAPAGELLELLLQDLGGSDVPAGRRGLAARLLAPALEPVVERLRLEAALPPQDQQVHASGVTIDITVAGPTESDWRAQLEQVVRRHHDVPAALRPAGFGALAVGALGLVLMVLDPGWVVLGLAGFGAAAWLLLHERGLRAKQRVGVEHALRRADESVAAAVTRQTEIQAESEQAVAAAERSAARLATAF
ncbi:hypothetical protein BH11ACT8_BH11ACT8_31830 [soil metagenome]